MFRKSYTREMLLQRRREEMNTSILSAMLLLKEKWNILTFTNNSFLFPTRITHLNHIRDTSCNNFVRKKDHVPAKFNPWFEMYLYSISEVRTKWFGEWRESFLWCVLRIREAPVPRWKGHLLCIFHFSLS